MENLLFSLNSTMPIFFITLIGYFLNKINIIDDEFAGKLNKFVFKISLPVLLFVELAKTDFINIWNTKFVLFCFFVTGICIFISFIFSKFIKSIPTRGEFIQASYRSSAALLGIAYLTNIYGNAGAAPLMMIGSVPLYNVMAVIVLNSTSNERSRDTKILVFNSLKGIFTNPIILGILFGFVWSTLELPMPKMLEKTLTYMGNTATPCGLLAMGASINLSKIRGELKNSLIAVVLKLIFWCALFLPIAIWLGFEDVELVTAIVMLGSPTTVASYVMARGMGHDGYLTTNSVIISTVLSAFTFTFWLWLFKSLGYI